MIVMKQFRKRGHWSLLLALALIPALTSCLESEDRPVIDPKDVATIQGLNGFYDPALGTDTPGDSKTYYRFEKRPDNRYALSAIGWNPATEQIEETHITEEGVFLKLFVNVPGSETFLGIKPPLPGCVGSCPTSYFEVRKMDTNFFVAFYGVSKDAPAIQLASKIGKTKNIVLSEKKITGDLRSRTLKELFSDGNFRKGLELEFIPLRPLPSVEQQRLAAAKTAPHTTSPSSVGSERTVSDFAGATESDTRDNSTTRELADLLQQLRAKVTSEGPFDLATYERLAAALQKSDVRHTQTQELLANARDFAGGKVRASMFVAYLKEALPAGDTSPQFTSTSLHWLQQKVLSGDLWAKYFVARAYFQVASGLRGKELASPFEAMGFPEEIRDHWEIYQLLLGDLDFRGSYEEAAKLAEEGAVQGSPPLTYLLGAMTLDGLGVAKDETKGLRLIRQAADGGFPIAILSVGNMYRDGKRVVKDEAEAARWYRKAADLGNASAMAELAIMYANGRGIPKDEAAAVRWFQKAAELGNPTAMNSLGVMYEQGRGVGQDLKQALEWYEKAAKLGNKSGKETVQRLASLQPGSPPRSAQEWADRYRNAPQLQKHEILKRLPPVQLDLEASAEVLRFVTLPTLRSAIINTIGKQGIRVTNSSPVTLRIQARMQIGGYEEEVTGRDYNDTHTHLVPIWSSEISVTVNTPILRDGEFYKRTVTPLYAVVFNDGTGGEVTSEDVLKSLGEEHVELAIKSWRTPSSDTGETPSLPETPWPQGHAEAMFARYLKAKQTGGEDLDRVFTAIKAIANINVVLKDDALNVFRKSDVSASWNTSVGRAGLSLAPSGKVAIKHEIGAEKINANHYSRIFGDFLAYKAYAINQSIVTVREADVVFELNGEFVRGDNLLWSRHAFAGSFWKERTQALSNMVQSAIQDFGKEARYLR